MDFLWVGAGGFLGAICRFLVITWISERVNTSFPLGTFIVNASGAFVFSLLAVLVNSMFPFEKELLLLTATGFLGSYTTFSTFMYETVRLWEDGEVAQGSWYLLGSGLTGLALAWAGTLTWIYWL
ncbi:MAG: fluoride efflux transporter CrcB [Bacillota bacterium]